MGRVGPSKLFKQERKKNTLFLGKLMFLRQYIGPIVKPKLGIWVRIWGATNLDEIWGDAEWSKGVEQGCLKRRAEFESCFRGKRKNLHNLLNMQNERNQIWLRGFHQGTRVDSSAINQERMPRGRDVFWEKKECIQFEVSQVWQASRIARWKCPEGWAQRQSEPFTLPFSPPLQNECDSAHGRFSPRAADRTHEAVLTFIAHQGSVRAWPSMRLESHCVNLQTTPLCSERHRERRRTRRPHCRVGLCVL